MNGQPWPRLIAITDLDVLARATLVDRLRRLAESAAAGSVAVLLRDHALGAKERLRLGYDLRDAVRAAGQQLWVADRLDLALLLGADALHLGEASVTPKTARRLVGAEQRVSRAWHAPILKEGAEGELNGVDALLVSPIVEPRKGRRALGLVSLGVLGEQLRARNRAYPLYALGGVSSLSAAACLAAGAHGVAAIGAALGPDALPLLEALEIRL